MCNIHETQLLDDYVAESEVTRRLRSDDKRDKFCHVFHVYLTILNRNNTIILLDFVKLNKRHYYLKISFKHGYQ